MEGGTLTVTLPPPLTLTPTRSPTLTLTPNRARGASRATAIPTPTAPLEPSPGAWGVAGFMATFVVYAVLLLPLSPIELLAGFLFPFWTALAICVAGKVTSSGVCFVIGRTVGAGFAWA